MSYDYNQDGQLRLVRRDNGVNTVFVYRDDGQLRHILHQKDNNRDTTYNRTTDELSNTTDDQRLCVLYYSFDIDGQLIKRIRRAFDDNETLIRTEEAIFEYNKRGEITRESYLHWGDEVATAQYSYDRAGNRLSKETDNSEIHYNYNSMHQLTSVEVNGIHTRYTYDALGRLTQSWYDANGNQQMDTDEERALYTWDMTGQLARADVWNATLEQTVVNYTYDDAGSGLLQTRNVGSDTTRYHWEGMNLYLEEENGHATRTYFNQPSAPGSLRRPVRFRRRP